YISTADSRYKCKFEIKQIDDKIVTLECEFNVGIIRNLIIKAAMNKDFKIFVESIARTIAEICNNQYSNNINNGKMAPSNEMLSCANCIFYEKSKNQCSILSKTIYDHNNPLCGGKYYIEIIR
ncbi:MAG: hypothetical protein GSR86_04985, partial [Desulfurococcales archaeon]|nr:hypothetical protein [Desulfurococcales archaeon]